MSVAPFERPGSPNLCRGHKSRRRLARIAVTVPVLVTEIVAG
jgi:hypothetical protein